ncbi:MAG TPA: hypothetical protein VIQ27_11360 [Gemmatimonadales bacterium]|jgi:hypothetical protein
MANPSGASRSRSRPRRSSRPRTRRYEPTPVYVLAEHLKRQGHDLRSYEGPWRPGRRPLRRPGRNAERAIPIVTNGIVEIAVDTAEHAADLSGFLNAAGLEHLDPVPNLRAPDQDLLPP